jgi:hypothetical protein
VLVLVLVLVLLPLHLHLLQKMVDHGPSSIPRPTVSKESSSG